MNKYHIRQMKNGERALQKELCYSESKSKTLFNVIEAQTLLWLFPLLPILVIWQTWFLAYIKAIIGYSILAFVYLVCVLIGSTRSYRKERKWAVSMERQSAPILEEFGAGQVEECDFGIRKAFILSEYEDEGPEYVLEIGENLYIIICGRGETVDELHIPGDHIQVARLPKSKIVITTYWSGQPVKIARIIDKEIVYSVARDCNEGDVIEINNQLLL